MTKAEFALRLQNACAAVAAAEQELSDIDARFGDADHGLTMSKIAGAISGVARGLAVAINGVPRGLAQVTKAVADQKEAA